MAHLPWPIRITAIPPNIPLGRMNKLPLCRIQICSLSSRLQSRRHRDHCYSCQRPSQMRQRIWCLPPNRAHLHRRFAVFKVNHPPIKSTAPAPTKDMPPPVVPTASFAEIPQSVNVALLPMCTPPSLPSLEHGIPIPMHNQTQESCRKHNGRHPRTRALCMIATKRIRLPSVPYR